MSRIITVVLAVCYKVTKHLASFFLHCVYLPLSIFLWIYYTCPVMFLNVIFLLLIVCTEEQIIRSHLCIWSAKWIHSILLFSSLRICGWSWSMSERNGESERSHYFCSSLSCPWSHSSRLIPALVMPFLRSPITGKNGKYAKLPKRTGTFL